jgi:drug/metabolite transporter (DMT)-like permease
MKGSFLYLWTAMAIFAASSSITRRIIELGQNHLIEGRNPISLCNVLFVGNLCALLVMLPLFHREWTRPKLQLIPRQVWYSLTGVALLSGALGPALVFTALDKTNVTNVMLIGRLEPIITLLLSMALLGSRVNFWTLSGSVVSFVGVALTIFASSSSPQMQMLGLRFGVGEILTAIAALVYALATILTRSIYLQAIPSGIVAVYRTLVGTLIFFILALWLYGSHHFVDAFAPILWQWMFLYATVIVVLGQSLWFRGFVRSKPGEIVLAQSFSPILAIFFAYLLLGEIPSSVQYRAGSLIILGIVFSWLGIRKIRDIMEQESSFKGV